ncbi:hypothetical protein P9112_004714 [Eukaryota sp. TZLM1-RC]
MLTRLCHSFRRHTHPITSLCWIGNSLVSSCQSTIIFWNVKSRRPVKVLNFPSDSTLPGGILNVEKISFKDQILIQYRGGQHIVYDYEQDVHIQTFNLNYSGFCKSLVVDSSTIVVVDSSNDKVILYDIGNLHRVKTFSIDDGTIKTGHVTSCLFKPPYTLAIGYESGGVFLFDIRADHHFAQFQPFPEAVMTLGILDHLFVAGSAPNHPLMVFSPTQPPTAVSLSGSNALEMLPGVCSLTSEGSLLAVSLWTAKTLILKLKEDGLIKFLGFVDPPLVAKGGDDAVFLSVALIHTENDRVFLYTGMNDGVISCHEIIL